MNDFKKGQEVIIKSTGQKCIVGYVSTTLSDNFVLLVEMNGVSIIDNFKEFSFNELSHATYSLLQFLFDNPSEKTGKQKPLTQREKELSWKSEWEAEQRIQNEINAFHL